MKIAFFKTEEWEKDYLLARKDKLGIKEEFVFVAELLDKHHIPAKTDFEVMSVFVDSKIDTEVLNKLPNVKFIATRSTGFDHIDTDACKARNVAVANVPSYGENTVAEFTFALILALSRKIYQGFDQIRETGSFSLNGLRGFDLKDKTLGVVGTGRIGKNVIKIARSLDMKVIAHDAYPDDNFAKTTGFTYGSLDEVLSESDIVTLHVPYMKETHHMINADTLKLMKKGSYLINTARGGVVETEALVVALKNGHLAGAGLDVLEEEGATQDELNLLTAGHPEEHNLRTILANHVLIDMPNVIITPHNAFNTWEGLKRILDTTLENIRSYASGEPKNLVK